jgi:hypothetical protein
LLEPAAQQLLGEERITLALGMEELGQGRVDGRGELTGCQLIYFFYRERSDPERGQNALAGQLRYCSPQGRIVFGLTFSIRTEDQESS